MDGNGWMTENNKVNLVSFTPYKICKDSLDNPEQKWDKQALKDCANSIQLQQCQGQADSGS